MTPESTSTCKSSSDPRHRHASDPTISSTSRSSPIIIPTSAGSTTSSHVGVRVLRRLCLLFSPRKPSSSAEKKHGLVDAPASPSTTAPTAVSNDIDDAGTSTAPPRLGQEFERVFRYFDENGDGKISPSELRSCMRTVGQELSAEDAEAVVESTDSDGDGLLGFEDFVKLVDVGGEEERTRDIRDAFAMYEMKGEGCITPKSLRRMLRRLGESKTVDECKVMIQRFDLNGDGVLSFDEFKLMML